MWSQVQIYHKCEDFLQAPAWKGRSKLRQSANIASTALLSEEESAFVIKIAVLCVA